MASGNGNNGEPGLLALGLEAVRRLFADEAVPLAGNIAFRTVFSIFPFLIFLTTLGGFFGNEALAEQLVNWLLSVAPSEIIKPLAPEIRSILTVPRTGLLSISAALTPSDVSLGRSFSHSIRWSSRSCRAAAKAKAAAATSAVA